MKNRRAGFSFLELLIVLAIILILATIAIPVMLNRNYYPRQYPQQGEKPLRPC